MSKEFSPFPVPGDTIEVVDGKNSHTASGMTVSYTPDSIFNVKR